jgi:glycopeptide antibiotics resistance protein
VCPLSCVQRRTSLVLLHKAVHVTVQGIWIVTAVALSGGAFIITLAILGMTMTSRQSRLDSRASKKLRDVGLGLSIASILVATLVPEEHAEGRRLLLNPIDGMDELQAPGNIALFVPLGALLRLRGTSSTKAMLVAAPISIAIEILQYFVIQGRSASTGDVILNLTGVFVSNVLVGRTRSAPRI